MIKRAKGSRSFMNSSFFIGIAIVLVAVLLGTYFFDPRNINYKELPYDELIVDQDFYAPSEYENWHTINLRSFRIETPTSYRFFKGRGIDSYVGGITNQIDTLFFDYGWYSDDLSEFDTMNVTGNLQCTENGK
jgi:hypothetical protein